MGVWCIAGITCCEIAGIAVIARDRRDLKPCSMEKAKKNWQPDLPDDPPL